MKYWLPIESMDFWFSSREAPRTGTCSLEWERRLQEGDWAWHSQGRTQHRCSYPVPCLLWLWLWLYCALICPGLHSSTWGCLTAWKCTWLLVTPHTPDRLTHSLTWGYIRSHSPALFLIKVWSHTNTVAHEVDNSGYTVVLQYDPISDFTVPCWADSSNVRGHFLL